MHLINKKTFILVTTLLLSLLQSTYAQTSINTTSDTAIENAILVHINQYRQQHGLSALKMNNQMVVEARQHSVDMAKHRMPFGHNKFNSRIDRLHAQVKNSGAGAENVAYNYKDAQDVVKNWLRSPGHKRNIDGNYNLTGIGIARDQNGKIYFTQIFLRTGANNTYAARKPLSNFFRKSVFR